LGQASEVTEGANDRIGDTVIVTRSAAPSGNAVPSATAIAPVHLLVICLSHVSSVRRHGQKLRLHQGLERCLAERSIHATQALNLFNREFHVRHLFELRANSIQDLLLK
jgi:hypothetical protein